MTVSGNVPNFVSILLSVNGCTVKVAVGYVGGLGVMGVSSSDSM